MTIPIPVMGEDVEGDPAMPTLNWDAFAKLPGSAEKNFELLCRGAVFHNFSGLGCLRSLANPPGVEFHLNLERPCSILGESGRWWGWQCKWYNLSTSSSLGTTRRKQIEEGVRKTETHVSGITDWVLWTRRPLSKEDHKWFNAISSKMTLHLWTEDDIDNLLVGQAAVLRGTYFGELILTPEILQKQHEQAVAPIRTRWQPEVHHVVDAERDLRRMLGDSGAWDELSLLADDLHRMVQGIENAPVMPTTLAPKVATVVDAARQSADALKLVTADICNGDIDLLRNDLAAQTRLLEPNVVATLRHLHAKNHLASLYMTNAVAGCREAVQFFTNVEAAFSSRIIAVIAHAGYGKTQLAAQITAATNVRPHGVLLHGRDLHANHTLDDLAQRVSIAAQPLPSFEALLAAIDAAGQRTRHRLPLVIDGLNESENPRIWKSLLAAVETTPSKYPYVLLICTLRPEFVGEVLPDGMQQVQIKGYGSEAMEAIREHFHYWKIDAPDVILPGFLEHPLTLRLFCEVTNPKRQKTVGIEAIPGSLTAIFDRYLIQVADRIAELAPQAHRYFPEDICRAITVIANKLWVSCCRAIDIDELRQALGDEQRPWDQSLVRALEHEGILFRMPVSNGNGVYAPVYDLLGGHIISNALLSQHTDVSLDAWIRNPSTKTLLTGNYSERHPFANDIVQSLVEQIPRQFQSKHLWQLVDEPLRSDALRLAASLEAVYLDATTVDALRVLIRQGDPELLEKLWELRGAVNHPLNAEGLDIALRPLSVADRDLLWTEWLRKKQDKVIHDLEHLECRWRQGRVHEGDRLRARWVMWTLTSTVRRLRDQATCALYWFGRADTEGIFELTIDSLSINDAYVGERMLAASYGVVMSYQLINADFEPHLKLFLELLAGAFVGASATAPTYHYLARLYVRGIVAFAEKFYATTTPNSLHGNWEFAEPIPIVPIEKDDTRADEVKQTLHMDFKNYTLGNLFEDRSNYDMSHRGHQDAVAHVCGTVWSLGWRLTKFKDLDRMIAQDTNYSRSHCPYAERYGKKYGWIGFFTYAGLLETKGNLPYRNRPLSSVDIDPSFPEQPPVFAEEDISSLWLSPSTENHEDWLRSAQISVPSKLLVQQKIGEYDGPWVAVHGSLTAEDKLLGRKVWASIYALVTYKQSASQLVAAFNKRDARQWEPTNTPSDYYTFADEIPWHQHFALETLVECGSERAYREEIPVGSDKVEIETLAHYYAWESYHSEINRAGSALVPSHKFSHQFDLHSIPQSFDQYLADGTLATISLNGIDGLKGNILYIHEDLFRQYVGERTVVWFTQGERNLSPYPLSPPQWLSELFGSQANAWFTVLTEADIK